ncbi:hypothetical protein BX611_1306 [Lutibacter oceani]|uniref:Uncharacterized protein n=1 Tax=Lutibacter oceani TaxID=1853311 RepID=A0A3D9RPC6_9FLAO|nr:hypothetical protein [Lutibacter oceani]REE81770.1 hypothetical protein BX611_1306 [Lutibacter oceani]
MELANIEKLLEKYLDAETTIAEEKQLKSYFLSDNVAPHLQEYQSMFGYFSTNKNERFTKTIQLKSQKVNWKWLSVAASVVLLVSVYTGYQNNQQKKAEKIYQETQMAFGMLAANLNKGNVAIAQLQYFENTKNKVFKQPKN